MAYLLLGIFSMSLPVVYGKGDYALGRLLSQLLTSSGNTSLLAWTGKVGSFNSCLPAQITVFNELATSHLPSPTQEAEMEKNDHHVALFFIRPRFGPEAIRPPQRTSSTLLCSESVETSMHYFHAPIFFILSNIFWPCLSRGHSRFWDGGNQNEI